MQATRGRNSETPGDARSKMQHLVDVANFEKNRQFAETQKRQLAKIKADIDENYQAAKAKLKADRIELIKASKKRFVEEILVIEKLQEANDFLKQMDALELDSQDIMEECELLECEIAKIMGKTRTNDWFEDARYIAKRVPWIGWGKFIPEAVSLGRLDWQIDDLDIDTDPPGSSEDDYELKENNQDYNNEKERREALANCQDMSREASEVNEFEKDDNEVPSNRANQNISINNKRSPEYLKEKQENEDSLFEVISGVSDINPYRSRSSPPPETESGITGTSGSSLLDTSLATTSSQMDAKRMRPYGDYRCHDFERVHGEPPRQEQHEDKDELSVFSDRIAKMKPSRNIFANSMRDIKKEASRIPAPPTRPESKFIPFTVTKSVEQPISKCDPFKCVRTNRTVTVRTPEHERPAHHCAKRIDITDIRNADTKTVVNDEFNKPMGIGGGQGKVFIPNSGGNSNNGVVFIYNLDGNYIATLRPPNKGFNVATSIIEINKQNSKLYVVKDNFKVYIFEEKEMDTVTLKAHVEFRYSFSLDKLGKMPVGLCYIDEHLFMANDDCFLSKLTLTGDLIDTFELNWRKCAQLTKRPRIRYANTFDKDIYLPCMANFKVIQSSKDGLIKRVFGEGFGSNVSQMRQPAGLTFDAVGNFIIADSKNHRLLIFDAKTGKSRTLHYPKKFSRPSDVHLHDDGTLCISSLDGNVYLMTVQGAVLWK